MNRRSGLPPITPRRMTHAVLGSMPSEASIAKQQYYAHPRNNFWPLAQRLLAVPQSAKYDERVHALQETGIGVWDVLASCVRRGSLDAAIELDTAVTNDLAPWFKGQPLVAIGLNGGAAARLFQRNCQPELCKLGLLKKARVFRLPSTSPANASQTFAHKLAAWRQFSSWQG